MLHRRRTASARALDPERGARQDLQAGGSRRRDECGGGSRERSAGRPFPRFGWRPTGLAKTCASRSDTVNNSLLIYADQANYRIIEATLLQVDKPQIQVAIDATIAEVTLTNDLSYGVQTYLTSRNVGLKPNTGSILNTQATTAPATHPPIPDHGAVSVAGR